MNNELFDTQEKIDLAISNFRTLMDHPGWHLFCQILDENEKILKAQLEEGEEDQTLDDIKLIRAKLSLTREHRNTPENIIQKLSPVIEGIDSDDPYDEVAEEEVA